MRRVVFLHPEPLEAELFRELFRELMVSVLLQREEEGEDCATVEHLCEHLDDYFFSLSCPREAVRLLAEGDCQGRRGREVLLVSSSLPGWQAFCAGLPHQVILLSGRSDPRDADDANACGALYRRLPNSVAGLQNLLHEIQEFARWNLAPVPQARQWTA